MSTTAHVDQGVFRAAMAQFPTFVTVVSTAGPDGPLGCTANAVMSLSTEPPSVLVSLMTGSYTLGQAVHNGGFAVNALAWSQRDLTRHFATGDPHRRFDEVPHELQDGVPVLRGASARLVCEVAETVTLLDHTLLVGRVTWSDTCPADGALVYYRHEQHPLHPGTTT
jgi:flavin reductase (DIM6/NTAB) family NADH-FMN oxidoreductase RutF